MSETEKERTLFCVTDGRVVSVSELAERTAGGGFAVIPAGNAAARLYRRLPGRKELPALAPADGVVTKKEGSRRTLRTADALELSVDLGEGAQVKAQVGERGRAPMQARSLTVPQMESLPMLPPGKRQGLTMKPSVVMAMREVSMGRTAASSAVR